MALPTKINVLAEMERLGRKFDWAGSDSIKTVCPFHEDTTPSLSITVETGSYHCFACKASGDFVSFFSKIIGQPRQVVMADLYRRYDISDEKTVDPQVIETWHTRLWQAGPLLKALHDRGVTDELIRQYRLGEFENRVTIPVPVETGHIVNVRKYLPGAPSDEKFKNMKGRGKPARWFPISQLRYNDILVCGGEMKAIVAADQLNKFGIGAISHTGGEGHWETKFTEDLKDKRVWVCYDVDETGVKFSEKHASALHSGCDWVGVVKLPLDRSKYPKGDINDFVGQENGDLHPLLTSCERWLPEDVYGMKDEVPEVVTLNQAYSHEWTGHRVSVEATVSATADVTYVIPHEVDIQCDKSLECCARCPVFGLKSTIHKINYESPVVLEFVDNTKRSQRDILMRHLEIPFECNVVKFDILKHMQADDVRISPKLEILNRESVRALQRVLCVSEGLTLNENYVLTGRQYPHPKDQSATLLISKFESTGDALTNFSLDSHDKLLKFQPDEWTADSIAAKLGQVYADFEYNVTHILQRQDMHLAMDLTWHSPLFIEFDGRVQKGHVESLIVGDSSQGKSEASKRLLDHYGVGTKVECKNATVAGLLGGLQKLNGRWFVSWGIIPTHDKRLVLLEELKGASTDVISKLTDMRSSGIAELPKIEKRRTAARTRLLALSNPRSENRPVSSYSFGVEIVRELIGALEDVRRFDLCMVIAKDEIDAKVINKPRSEWKKVDHVYDDESCRSLILWSWTRSEAQVKFTDEASIACLEAANAMCEIFSSEVPIVDTASQRYKIARLAAALAARTFSHGDTVDELLVRKCHVEYIHQYMTRVYSTKAFGYLEFSRAVKASSDLSDVTIVEKQILSLPYPKDVIENMLRTIRFDKQDLSDWCALDRIEVDSLVSLLVRKRAIERDGRTYRKTPGMIDLLKGLLTGDRLPKVPEHLKDPRSDF